MKKPSWRHGPACGLLLLCVVACGVWFPATVPLFHGMAQAETYYIDDDPGDSDSCEKSVGDTRPSSSGGSLPDDGLGIEARAGYIAFKTFGRDDGLTHVELMPFAIGDDQMLFADIRLFMTDDTRLGGNAGLGFRHRVDSWDRVFGAGLWYDVDDTSGETFHQMALGLETYGSYWDFRANVYFPIDSESDFQTRPINLRFSDHNILYDRYREYGEAMEGLDLELGFPVPFDFARDYDLRVYGGWYSFWGDAVSDINGYKFRAEAYVTDYITTEVGWTGDDTFGQNFTLGVAITTPGGFRGTRSNGVCAASALRRYPQRNYNIIVSKGTEVQSDLTAVDPETGQAYVVQHVSSSGAGQGTPDDPFATIAEAQAAGGDIIFVHAGSVFSDPVVLADGERILGEGVRHPLEIQEFGTVALPTVTGGTERPELQGVVGPAVTLASNTEFAGFVIDAPTGNGIIGDAADLNGALVRNVNIEDAGNNGVLLRDVTGQVTFRDVNVTNTAGVGAALYVNRGSADITFSGVIENSITRALLVKETTGGTVDLSAADIHDEGGTGIGIFNTAGSVIVGDATVRNGSGVGIDIQTGSGDVEFRGTTTVQNAAAVGIKVKDVTGDVVFNTVNVTGSDGDEAVRIVDTPGSVTFGTLNATATNATALAVADSGSVSVDAGTLSSVGGSAANIENTEMDIHLTGVNSDGAVNGLRIVGSDGEFIVSGGGDYGSGGLIQNATGAAILVENSGTVALRGLDLDANATGISATNTEQLVLDRTRFTNTTGLAVDALNTRSVEISNSELDTGVRLQVDTAGTYDYRIAGSTIDVDSSSAVVIGQLGVAAAGSSLALNVSNNEITVDGAGDDAVSLGWDGPLVATFSENTFTGTGGANDGIDITTTSTTDLADITLAQNTFAFDGGNDTGLRVNTAGPANLTIGQNNVDFDAADGIGFNFTLAKSADVNIFQNAITDNAGGGTGILFTSIAGPSNVTLNSNQVDLLGAGIAIDQGIIFSAVDTTTDVITLLGTEDNLINGATTDFYVPIGTTTGQIYVNGELVP